MKHSIPVAIYFLALLFCVGCSKDEDPHCETLNVVCNISLSEPCRGTGTIIVQSPVGPGFSYSINGTSFRSTPRFDSLMPKTYTVTVQDANGCTSTTQAQVDVTASGILFAAARDVLERNCVSCHSGSNPQAGINFRMPCDILQYWDRMKARAIDGNPTPMPPSGFISPSDRDKLLSWINAGHRYPD